MDAAQAIIQCSGYNSFTYRELSVAVGIRKASIHYYFPKKEDLALALIKRYTETFTESLNEIQAKHKSPIDQADAYFQVFQDTLRNSNSEKCCLAGIMGNEINTLPKIIHKQVEAFCRYNEQWLVDLIKSGVAEKSFNRVKSHASLAKTVFSALEGAMMLSRLNRSSNHLDHVVVQLKDLLYR